MRKTLSFLLVLALAVCMLPGLALAEEAPTFDLAKDLEGITIPDDLVTCTCTKTNESKQYGQLPNGFSASKVIKEGEVWTVLISVKNPVYKAKFDTDTGSTHAPDMNHSNDFTTPIQFKLKYEGKKWMLDGAMPKNKTLHFTCDGKHLMPRPDHPTADAIDGLGKDIVGVVCANAPDKSKFYGLIDGGFSTTEPKANAENVYESTITLSPSAYCNQYNTDTGIEHTLNPNQTTEGLSFTVKYDPEKKMWMPVDEVRQMGIWVVCDKHEVQTRYTVTYSDGMNGSIFATENYADLNAGDTTPSFKGSTYRYGYRFDGWKPAWSANVSGNVTYVAQWTYVGGGGGGHYHPNPTSVPPMIKPPQTGDNSNTTLWLALLLVSSGALVGIAVFAQKRRKT